MNEDICCITNEEKTAKNEWKNYESYFLPALCIVYKNYDNSFSMLYA